MTNHIKHSLLFTLSLIFSISSVACKRMKFAEVDSFCKDIKEPCLDGKINVLIQTKKGEIIIELNGNSAPITAGNFLDLINRKIYNGTSFHRVIKSPYPFIIQAGNIRLDNRIKFNKNKGGISNIKSHYTSHRLIPLELKLINENKPRYNSKITNPKELSLLELTHKRGALAMARAQGVNSASTQFYIALKALPELDGRYSVFGKVIKGMQVVDSLEQGEKILTAITLLKSSPRDNI